MLAAKRVYEPAFPRDGTRFLVERLWPRGMKKENLRMKVVRVPATLSRGTARECGGAPAAARCGAAMSLCSTARTMWNTIAR